MHLPRLIADLAVILALAGLVSLLFERIRQPVVLGYILAGAMVRSSYVPLYVHDSEGIRVWADLGVVFLMFSLGLEFSFRKLLRLGLAPLAAAVFEVGCLGVVGALAGRFVFGWSDSESLVLAGVVAISSTTIIYRTLNELGLKTRRFAEHIFSMLVVEDLVAILLLASFSAFAGKGEGSPLRVAQASVQLLLTLGSWVVVGYFFLPRAIQYVGAWKVKHQDLRGGLGQTSSVVNDEVLMILSLGLCLSLVVLADRLGYSPALGAFVMGSILAETSESYRIEERIAPLRDLFAAVFFVSVGMLIDPAAIGANLGAIALVAAVVVLGKITFVSLGMLAVGQSIRTAVQVGFGMAQVGEFSFLIAGVGVAHGMASPRLTAIAVAVSVLTTLGTPFLIRRSNRAAAKFERRLPLRVRDRLTRYAAWMQQWGADSALRVEVQRGVLRWVLSAVALSAFTSVIHGALLPWVVRTFEANRPWAAYGGWALTLLATSPLSWAMWNALRASPGAGGLRVGLMLVSRLLTLLCWVMIAAIFLPAGQTLAAAGVGLALFALAFYSQLSTQLSGLFGWLEGHWVGGMQSAAKKSRSTKDVLRSFAPWDAHLVRVKLHPNSEFVLQSLRETGLRDRWGINVVAIQRGLRTLVAPLPEEKLLPKDELLVLGDDEHIDRFRAKCEKPPGLEGRFKHLSDYEMRALRVMPGMEWAGKTIRQAGLRERHGAMVVGLEYGVKKVINPNSDHTIAPGEILWIVGEKGTLEGIEAKLNTELNTELSRDSDPG